MKTIYNFLIIMFVILSIFLLKDDISLVYKNVSTYLNKNIKNQIINIIPEKEKINISNIVDTPGALRIVTDLLVKNDNELSRSGIIELTNIERQKKGNMPMLKENKILNLSAEKKLKDMFDNQYFEHTSPSGVGVADLGEQFGYEYILIGENLALGNFKDDKALVDAWMNSPGHKANILNIHYREIGVAVGKGNFEGKNIWLAVQHFGTPIEVCPIVDEVLAGTIDINQNTIAEIEKDIATRIEIINRGAIYQGMSYFEQINKYNSLVNSYNKLIKITKEKIDEYNNQIRALNLCISENK